MTPDLVARYAQPLPRYTSYPTAPHFHAGIGPAEYGRWLAELPADLPASLYLHIPYCKSLCWYCGCSMRVTNRPEAVARYVDTLLVEIGRVAERIGRRQGVAHVHFGGGSPSLLPPAEFARLMAALRDRFALAADAEIAMEIDPRGFDPARAAAYAAAGLNRASLGVQDFEPAVQEAINRRQSFAETQAAVEALRRAGIAGVNLDFLYGLPHQTEASVARSVALGLELAPARVALFGYAHVPWMKKHQRLIDAARLPDAWARWRQATAAGETLAGAGYVPIGLDHFAAPGDPMAAAARERALRRNFQGYTTDRAGALIGFGASAIGALPQGYVQNAPDIAAYTTAVGQGGLPIVKGRALTAEDRLRRAAIERVMCDLALDAGALCREFGAAEHALDDGLARLNRLQADGLLRRAGRRIEVPEAARLFVRHAAAAFDAYLAPAAQPRHAAAI